MLGLPASTQISKLIPQNIVFALNYDGKMQLAIYHGKLIAGVWAKAASAVLHPYFSKKKGIHFFKINTLLTARELKRYIDLWKD